MTEPREFSYDLRDVRVVFADGAISRLKDAIDDTFGSSRILIVSTPGRAETVEKARIGLGSTVVGTFERATLHVPVSVVADALDVVGRLEPDCVVAVGGGSAVGLGKALVKESGLPLVAVPTTYSGSEMTNIWGVSDGERKQTGRDLRVAPRLVVYDPQLTHSMPPHITGPSGVNAIAHSVEALYSSARSPVSSILGADGIRGLSRSLPVLASDPYDRRARWDALYGAHLCGRSLDMTTMGLHHKLCHVLGGTLGLPHALTHAIVLPHASAYNATAAPEAMATVASSLGVAEAALGLWHLNHALGITATLTDLGMRPSDLDRVIANAISQTYPNPAPVTAEGIRSILVRAMGGEPPG